MPIQNMAEPKFYPDYVNEAVALMGKVRDFNALRETPLTSGDTNLQPGNVIYGWQFDELFAPVTGVLAGGLTVAQGIIQAVRGVANTNPLADIDPMGPPEPDLLDYYYFVPGTYVPTNTSSRSLPAVLRIKPEWPWPPWGVLPPAPPPVNVVPLVEEDYAYIYGCWSIIQYLVADREVSKLEFEYAGFFAMEMAKRCYELFRFQQTEAMVKTWFLDALARVRPIF